MRNIPIDKASKLYLDGMSVHEVGKELGFCGAGIFKALRRAGIKLRGSGTKGRPWAIRRRGKEYLGADGRWWVRGIRSSESKNAKRRAVVVMEKKLGHRVPNGFHVHHANENIQDDKPDNLELLKSGSHSRRHHLGKRNPRKASMTGKKHSQETILKMSRARKNYWRRKRGY